MRERRATVSISDPEEKSAARFTRQQGPKPSEVYGFVGSITTVIATGFLNVSLMAEFLFIDKYLKEVSLMMQ